MVQTTGVRQNGVSSPGRGAGLKVTFVKFHAASAKQFQILFAKRTRAMMLGLLFDVTPNRLALGRTYRKRTVPFLPSKPGRADLIVDPTGRNSFQIAKHISKAVGCAKANQ